MRNVLMALPRKFIFNIVTSLLSLVLLATCNSDSSESFQETNSESKIFASNYPLAYFAQRITEDPDQIYFPEIDGDPAFWEPEPDEIVKIQQCNPLLLNGATYEKWRKVATLPENRIINTSAEFQDELIEITEAVTHQHGPDGDHSHGGTAFTTWIDFSLATKQAMVIANSLVATKPTDSDDLKKNLTSLINDLHLLHDEMIMLAPSPDKANIKLFASHPIYQYFGRAYQLDIQSMLWEPDVFPSEEQWSLLEKKLPKHPAKWMIWEGKPLDKSVQRLKKMGINSVVFDPCANIPESGDFLSVMKQNIENLRPVFQTPAKQ